MTSAGLIHVNLTRARHHAAVAFLFGLVLDLDLIRIGRPSDDPITLDRLAKWWPLAEAVRACSGTGCRMVNHDAELTYGDGVVTTLIKDLENGHPLVMPLGVEGFLTARGLLERCRDPHKKH